MRGTGEVVTDYYCKLYDDLPFTVWFAGLDGGCRYVNKAYLDFTGRSWEQERGEGWLDVYKPGAGDGLGVSDCSFNSILL